MYIDGYANLYQKLNGFKIQIYQSKDKMLTGYLSLKPSTRSTYDIAMRDATIDGLITMDKIERLQPGQIFYKEVNPNELFILQSVNQFEFQIDTRNINAIKQNSFVTLQREEYDAELGEEIYKEIYKDLIAFITTVNKDEKNFAAGIEDNTNIIIQIPKRDLEGNLYIINNQDRIILNNLRGDLSREIKVESIDEYSIPGIIKIFGTYETRTGDSYVKV